MPLKLMSDDHKYLTAFRYEKNQFALKVSAVYIGEARVLHWVLRI